MGESEARSLIREAGTEDGPGIAAIYAPFVRSSAVSFKTFEPDGEEMAARVAVANDDYPWLVCEAEGEVAGYAYASAHRSRDAYGWTTEVSVNVHEPFSCLRSGQVLVGGAGRPGRAR